MKFDESKYFTMAWNQTQQQYNTVSI